MESIDNPLNGIPSEVTEPSPLFVWDDVRSMRINVSEAERWASAAFGGGLVAYGLRKRGGSGIFFLLAGVVLLVRGALGRSLFYRSMGINTATGEGMPGQDRSAALIRIDKSIAIARSAEEIYRHIRQVENLPGLFSHLRAVEPLSGLRSRWSARMPSGAELEWETEISEERSPRKLSWRSVSDHVLRSEGSIVLDPLAGGRTQMGVHLEYILAPGKTGRVFAKLFGKHPDRLLDEELHRFKSKLEAGG